MRVGFLVLVFGFLMGAGAVFADDRAMSCQELEREILALEASARERVVVSKDTMNAGANVATQAAGMAGVGREASLINSVVRLFSTMVPSRPQPAEPALSVEAQKRIARLETVAEMKDCYE